MKRRDLITSLAALVLGCSDYDNPDKYKKDIMNSRFRDPRGNWAPHKKNKKPQTDLPERITLSNPDLYFNPDQGFLTTGDAIDSWTDVIKGFSAEQTGSRRPTYFANTPQLNNKPSVYCNQNLYQNLISAAENHVTHFESNYTIFFVLAPTYSHTQTTSPPHTTRQYLLYPGNDVGGAELEKVAWAYKANWSGRAVHGYAHNPVAPQWSYAPIHVANRPMVLSYTNTPTGSQVWRNGVKIGDNLAYIPRKFENGFTIFSAHTEPEGTIETFYDGYCADILAYIGDKSESEVEEMHTSLMNYYNIPSYIDMPASIVPEFWINAESNYGIVSGGINEIGNQGYEELDLPKFLTAPASGNRGTIGSITVGSRTYPTLEANGSSTYYTGAAQNWKWTDIAVDTEFCIWAWFVVDTWTNNSGSAWLNNAILAQAGSGNVGLYGRSTSGGQVYTYGFDNNADLAVDSLVPSGSLVRVRGRHSGGNLYIRVGNNTEISDPHGITTGFNQFISLFRFSTQSTFFDGQLVELVVKKSPTADDLAYMDFFHTEKYPDIT